MLQMLYKIKLQLLKLEVKNLDNFYIQNLNLAKLQKEGFAHYYAREFTEAIKSFDDAGQQWSDINAGGKDAAAALLKDRCIDMLSNPPPEGWNGVEVLNQKHF